MSDRTTAVIPSTTPGRSLRISGYPPEELVDRQGKPFERHIPVNVGFALDDSGSVIDRWRQLTPAAARDAAAALLRAADVADGTPSAPSFSYLDEDPDAPDDGLVLVAGVLYNAKTGEEASA
jgi:hypothetical protein